MTEIVSCEELSCPADTGLHLIRDSQYILRRGKLIYRIDKSFIERIDTAFALYVLEHHRANGIIELCFEVVDVVGFSKYKTLCEREEVVVENILPGSRQRCDSSAVEGVHEGDDVVSAFAVLVEAVFSCYLDSALVGFCAGVSEKHLRHARRSGQLVSKICLYFCVVVVRCMLYFSHLLAYRVSPFAVAVAEGVCADTAAEIYVFLSVFIGSRLTDTAVHYERIPSVCAHNVFIEFFYGIHELYPFIIRFRFLCRTKEPGQESEDRAEPYPHAAPSGAAVSSVSDLLILSVYLHPCW